MPVEYTWCSVRYVLVAAILCIQPTDAFGKIEAAYGPVVKVKYRKTPVDLGHPRFAFKDTSKSSYVRGAWYDGANRYMVIRLKATYYHFCRMPSRSWSQFKAAPSHGRHFSNHIKGHYDCRQGGVPSY